MKALGDILEYEQPTKYIVSSENYNDSYATPVLTAGQTFILGYTNETEGIYSKPLPVVIFDDFTTAVKFVNFPFKVKSSAMKILKAANKDVHIPYWYYYLTSVHIDNDLHKRYWISTFANMQVNIPSLKVQRQIAARLDKAQELIALQKEQIKKADELIKSRFIEMFGDPISNPKKFVQKTIDKVSEMLFAGGDREQDISPTEKGEYVYPVYSNGETNNGLLGYSKKYRVAKQALTISARGTIGFLVIREPCFTPVVRLITLIPQNYMNIVYLKYMLNCIKFVSSGTSQGQLTIPNFKKIKVIIPSLSLQNKFADFVAEAEKQKKLLNNRLSMLETLYKSLMQEYFGEYDYFTRY